MVSDTRLKELLHRWTATKSANTNTGQAPSEVSRTAEDIESCLYELTVWREQYGLKVADGE